MPAIDAVMKTTLLIIVLFLLSYGLGQWLSDKDARDDSETIYVSACDPNQGICHVNIETYDYQIRFEGEASPLTPFYVYLEVTNQQPEAIEIQFAMDSMDMGYNFYQMKKQAASWQSKVILPVCSLARNDWKLNVKLIYKDKLQMSEFSFSQ